MRYNIYERYKNSMPYYREFAIRAASDYQSIELECNGFLLIHTEDRKSKADEWLDNYISNEDLIFDDQTIL